MKAWAGRRVEAGGAVVRSCAVVVLTLSCVSCTDLILAHYRDEALLDEHRYALGEQYECVENLRFCYQEYGAGKSVVIFPGLCTSIDFWQLNIPSIAKEYHVLAVDPPGFGKSDKPDASYDLPWICDRIIAFLDAKGVQQATFMGGSMGGHLGVLIALSHPERVEKLVLMGSSGSWEPPGVLLDPALKGLWNEAIVTDYLRRSWPDFFRIMFKEQTPVTRSLLRYQMALRADAARYAPEGRATARAMRRIFYASCRGRLAEVRQPVLLIWGEHDCVHPLREARYFHSHLPESVLVVVPDAAHEAMIDQPEVFNRTVLAFLREGIEAVRDGHVEPITPQPLFDILGRGGASDPAIAEL